MSITAFLRPIAGLLVLGLSVASLPAAGQLLTEKQAYTHGDTLRGTMTPERTWWNLLHYHLQVRVNPTDSTFSGQNTIKYRVVRASQVMQIDLQSPMTLIRAEQDGQPLPIRTDGNAHFITLAKPQRPGRTETITVDYGGKPRVAKNAPWDGGVSWARDTDSTKSWFIATSCQGLGSSVWWPCKDHMYDEPDSMLISVTVPEPYMDVSNGQLRRVVTNADHTRTYDWAVVNPINNYGVNVNIAKYVTWNETYQGESGPLQLSFFALPKDEAAARVQFQQAKTMLRVFENWFGPYPFYKDGYKLVQVPYLGMEHQSSVTYGNKFRNGYLGRDLSRTGWGLRWDFIIVHESGHEWFANNITYKDIADMWIHESFTAYSENLYTEALFGKNAGAQYVIGTRVGIRNDRPIIGDYNVNSEGSGDMYYKGANMLHMIRQGVGNDEKWRQILRGLNKTFYHQTVTTQQIESYLIKQTGLPLKPLFDQYLRDARVPVLEYKITPEGVAYRFANCQKGFTTPIRLCLNDAGPRRIVTPSTTWQTLSQPNIKEVNVDADYYVLTKMVDL
ncbi:M1 family metallopeptidase [Fibrella forsythiae]|uniref:M1 family metallopeptidase n=1 Tax=Fibrella forsythiae TaxID=2817061 RepID=A0ABS3JIS5_9BACT|nr:M1 family metallopeptidase [Fibrella forsythiae]MBO0949139.1 M1 family metallopeptidase [Fibrella forsythiae]